MDLTRVLSPYVYVMYIQRLLPTFFGTDRLIGASGENKVGVFQDCMCPVPVSDMLIIRFQGFGRRQEAHVLLKCGFFFSSVIWNEQNFMLFREHYLTCVFMENVFYHLLSMPFMVFLSRTYVLEWSLKRLNYLKYLWLLTLVSFPSVPHRVKKAEKRGGHAFRTRTTVITCRIL